MRLFVFSSIRELDSAPRKFLLFTTFNVISWQCIVGPALVLFARKIDMPASWVGFLISFMPLSMVFVLGTTPLVTWLGSKRLMFTTWMLRNLIAGVVFLMPWAVAHCGTRAAWYVLLGATLGFCLMRAAGAGAWFPWLHEVVPENQRGAYFSAEASVAQMVNIGVILGQGLLLRGDPDVGRFLIIYAVGIVAGLVSLIWMYRVPGGDSVDEGLTWQESYSAYRAAFSDRAFLWFVVTAALCFSCTSWLGSALVLYMRDALGLSSRTIMILMAAGSVGVLLTIRHWARFAEHSGSGATIFLSLSGHSIIALTFLVLAPGVPGTFYALGPVLVLGTIFGGAQWMAAHRAMLNYVKTSARVGYTNLWTVGTALTMGITPILAGQIIDAWGLWGFRTCFLIAGLAGFLCALASRTVVRDGAAADALERKLRAPAPVITLAKIIGITLGIHKSNRRQIPQRVEG
ncbi:MAG: hypothetical protein HY706_02540 [Candidatus Hydrogenedentes bacterium]|nr:hypothetical protein [Candidatus Hydrogenedentota bacterium]